MSRRKARLLGNGRNAGSTAFLKLDNYIFDCAAYRTMKPGPRALLSEVIRRHNGSNNGHIGFGVRAAAEALCVSNDTAAGYFKTLVERGFIAPARPGGFNMKNPEARRATEWRLTWIATENIAATKDFMAFAKKSTALKIRTLGPNNLDTGDENGSERPKNPDLNRRSRHPARPNNPDTYTSSHRRGVSGDASPCAPTWLAIRKTLQPMESVA